MQNRQLRSVRLTNILPGKSRFRIAVGNQSLIEQNNFIKIIRNGFEVMMNNQKCFSRQCMMHTRPATQTLTVNFESNDLKSKHLEVFNTLGMRVFEGKIDSRIELNVSEWSRGVYYLKLENEIVKVVLQ